MHKLLVPLAVFSAMVLCGCTQTYEKTSGEKNLEGAAKPEIVTKAASPNEGALELNSHKIENEEKEVFMSATAQDFWVKKPGTGVYNNRHVFVRSLRLQPKVTIHKEVNGWGLIDPYKDEWVNMSDITLMRPAGMLEGPQESTELPRITVEEMMKAGK